MQTTLSDLRERMISTIQSLSGGVPAPETPEAAAETTGEVKEEKEEVAKEEEKFEVVIVDGEEFIKCPQCGTLNSKDAIMCYNCGYIFKPEEFEG
ncbi:hypothetical protein B6U71_01085 [Euryarchaeota archaeon ex4484_178]|nr:MAG: hypothetical protein B6U71_01085 [Euryarchaeota archaeon ex4484_178]